MPERNRRETGARKYPQARDDTAEEFSQDAAKNKAPKPYGLTTPKDDVPEERGQSDGRNKGDPGAGR